MKVAAQTLTLLMPLLAQSQGEQKTVTLTPNGSSVSLVTASSAGSTKARILAITEEENEMPACALPAHLLSAIAKTATAEVITLTPLGATQVAANAGASNSSLSTSEPVDFPALDPTATPEGKITFTLPISVLAASIGRVLHATAKETNNLAYNMIQLIITKEGSLITAALDGKRLAFSRTDIPDWQGETAINLLFPRTRQVETMLELAPEANATVMVTNNKILVAVETEALGIETVLNTADIAYPEWRKPLEAMGRPTIVAKANTKALRALMARANAICPTTKVALKLTDTRLWLGAKNETVQHVDALDLEEIKGLNGEFTIYTSPTLIAEALDAVATWTAAETVQLGFIAPTKPIVLAATGYAYSNYVWPMAASGGAKEEQPE